MIAPRPEQARRYEPMICTPGRKIGLAISDTVIVTRSGARRLGKGVDELIVV